MTIVAQEPTAAHPQTEAPPPIGVRPRISANRRLLVRRFPSLGFTVSTGGLAFWEVLLFTDRSLIDPANAGKRTPANFYSSRQDVGLRRAASVGDDVFLVPSTVLRGFAAAVPKPSAIYYTVAAYATPDAAAPIFPELPAQLAHDAPLVSVSPDFTADTIDRALGVRSGRLQVVAQALDAQSPAFAPAPAQQGAPAPAPAPTTVTPAPTPSASPSIDPAEDAGAGEDGFSYLAQHPELAERPRSDRQPAGNGGGNGSGRPPDVEYDDGYGPYDDGWTAQGQSWAAAQEATFPHGYPKPTQLPDEDTNGDGDGYGSWAPASAQATELAGVAPYFPYHALDDPADAAAPAPTAVPAVAIAPQPLKLTIDDKRSIIEKVAGAESGSDRYGAINADGEFKGRFGATHPAYQHYHIGLSYGIVQFTQESGNLGRLLAMMRDRDATTFRQIFGDHADELVAVTTASGPPASESQDGRSARTQPVDGADLWDDPWVGRFRQAGQVTAFQAAQNELAATAFLDPVLGFAGDIGLDTDRALTMVVDRSVQMGVGGALHWIAAAVGPISTPALRQQALAALHLDDLSAFQRAWRLPADNLWGPLTHAGLVGALRQLGSGSPIPLPAVDQMLDAMVRRADADGAFWAGRVKRLRAGDGFTDAAYPR